MAVRTLAPQQFVGEVAVLALPRVAALGAGDDAFGGAASDMLDAVLVTPLDLCGGERRQVLACRHDALLEFRSRFHN